MTSAKTKVFLNISNHAVAAWTEKQKNAALELGESIGEIPFPNISPSATSKEVQKLAIGLMLRIVNEYGNDVCCMVGGEFTFTHSFVEACYTRNIECYAATTERNTVENPDGTKTVKFEFEQFRKYLSRDFQN